MKTQIVERLSALREAMKANGIAAYIIPTSDPHMSEYPAKCWKYREWISGFSRESWFVDRLALFSASRCSVGRVGH